MRWTEKIVATVEFVGFFKKNAETEGCVGLVKHFEEQRRRLGLGGSILPKTGLCVGAF